MILSLLLGYVSVGASFCAIMIVADLVGSNQLADEMRKYGPRIGHHTFLIIFFLVLILAWPFLLAHLLWKRP